MNAPLRPLALAALLLSSGACLDLITVIPDDFEVVPAGADAGGPADGGADLLGDASVRPPIGGDVGDPQVFDAGASPSPRVPQLNAPCSDSAQAGDLSVCLRFNRGLENEAAGGGAASEHGTLDYAVDRQGNEVVVLTGAGHVRVASAQALYRDGFTLAMRVQADALQATQTLFSSQTRDADRKDWGPFQLVLVEGRPVLEWGDESQLRALAPLTSRRWAHLMAVYHPNGPGARTMRLYVDGALQGAAAVDTTLLERLTLETFYDGVGAQLAWDNTQLQPIRPFGGVIDDLRVWSSPLIDADLAAEAGQWVEDFEAGDLTGWSCFNSEGIDRVNVIGGGRAAQINQLCERVYFAAPQRVARVSLSLQMPGQAPSSDEDFRLRLFNTATNAEVVLGYSVYSAQFTLNGVAGSDCAFDGQGQAPRLHLSFTWGDEPMAELSCDADNTSTVDVRLTGEGWSGVNGMTFGLPESMAPPVQVDDISWRMIPLP